MERLSSHYQLVIYNESIFPFNNIFLTINMNHKYALTYHLVSLFTDCQFKRATWKLEDSSIKSKISNFRKKLRIFFNPPPPTSTCVIPLANNIWSASISIIWGKVYFHRRWGPCNRNLLDYKKMETTMTLNDNITLKSIKDASLSSSVTLKLCFGAKDFNKERERER